MTPLLAAMILQSAAQVWHPMLTFSAHPELRRVTTQVEVGFLPDMAGASQYWFRKTVTPDGGKIVETAWTDTRSCPAARPLLENLARLEAPHPHLPGLDGNNDIAITMDGVTYRLDADSAPPFGGGRLVLRTNVGTPLAQWVESALTGLAACWKPTPPDR